MKRGYLSDYFVGVAAKRVSPHEIDPTVSRGHEFQGVSDFCRFIGEPTEKRRIPASFLWLDDEDVDRIETEVTWYDSRRGKTHRRPEWRLYYLKPAEPVIQRAKGGDSLFLAQKKDGSLLFILTPAGSSTESQLSWLFGVTVKSEILSLLEPTESERFELGFTGRILLEMLGFSIQESDDDILEKMVRKFGNVFPTTKVFSGFARDIAGVVDVQSDPDQALMSWVEMEDRIFRIFEAHIIGHRIAQGFIHDGKVDVDTFISYSLSTHQRRKSRAGHSLENHLEHLFMQKGLAFQRGAKTEGNKTPDFLFPGSIEYANPEFPESLLTLLGAKTTCKDRWRQVLSEGGRVTEKHLLTLEPAISPAQTNEMQLERLSLVIPFPIHATYLEAQRNWLMTVSQFLELVEGRAKYYP